VHTLTARVDNLDDELYRNHLSYIKDLTPEMGRRLRRIRMRENCRPLVWVLPVLAVPMLFVGLPWLIRHPPPHEEHCVRRSGTGAQVGAPGWTRNGQIGLLADSSFR
jgi:hypothetical protein